MKVNRAIVYRIYPTDQQKGMFMKTFGCCRKIYNLMLSDKIRSYEETKSFERKRKEACKGRKVVSIKSDLQLLWLHTY